MDANLIVRMHDPSALEHQSVLDLWERCIANRVEIIAPALLRYEVTNALFRSAAAGLVSETEATSIIRSMNQLPIKYFDGVSLNVSAFEIARALNLKAAYDAHYLALSLREGAEFFTVDKRLVVTSQPSYPFVHYVMDL
ncbi:MAG TPA: type II toxin-antitoxin system VapC family toxin [Thermomicrobiales bacterium]|nr:type II toxin-antitoxin system VapC family toxin [Thermomicrobiales bacterium]